MRDLIPICALSAALLLSSGCSARTAGTPAQVALRDTTVCVVDRSVERGLRNLAAVTRDGEVLVETGGALRPLAEIHPVSLLAGYAGRESWFRTGEPITVEGARFLKYQGERRVPLERVSRVADYRGVPLYGEAGEPSPLAVLYVPTEPGCVFQPYIREDVLRGARPR